MGRIAGLSATSLIIIAILAIVIFQPGIFSGLGGGLMGGNGKSLDGPLNVNLVNTFSGALIDGEGIEIYKPGSAVPVETWDVDSDTAADSALTYKSGDVYLFVVCEGTAAQSAGVGCEGTDGGVREFGAADSVRSVSVTIPFATSTDATQHNIAISIVVSFDDGTGEDISWLVVSGTESLTDNDGSTTDNDYSGDGGVGVAAEVEEFTSTQTHRVTIANVNDNTGWNSAFTIQDSNNNLDLRLYAFLRNENGTGVARIVDGASQIWSASGTQYLYDFGSLISCFQREVVGTVVKQQGICSFTFTIEHGTYTAASAFTQVTFWLVQYVDTGDFGQSGTPNPEAFLDAATTDCTFDFFVTDA